MTFFSTFHAFQDLTTGKMMGNATEREGIYYPEPKGKEFITSLS